MGKTANYKPIDDKIRRLIKFANTVHDFAKSNSDFKIEYWGSNENSVYFDFSRYITKDGIRTRDGKQFELFWSGRKDE